MREGHTIVSTQQRGHRVTATREGYPFGRRHDIISERGGTTYLTEVKFRKDTGKRRSIARKIGRRLDPRRKLAIPPAFKRAGTTLAQLYFDVKLESDITLSGSDFAAGGETFSEMDGDIQIQWQLWSAEKDEVVLPITTMKRVTDPEKREEMAEQLHEGIMDHVSVQ